MPRSGKINRGKMKLVINGEIKELMCGRVSGLLDELGLNKDTVAVELNRNIVHREDFGNAKLKENDKIEIVKVVGGG